MYRRALPGLALALALVLPATGRITSAADIPTDRGSIDHALNRLTYGPRPGDAEAVARIGLSTWIDRQLSPGGAADEALARRLPAAPMGLPPDATPRQARQYARRSIQTLAAAKLIRAVHGERQLEEVLVDFWFNHFNVFAGKGRTAAYLADYEREAIRPHVFGRFRDLLGASAKSPAMLFYLDNWLSADPEAVERLRARRAQLASSQALERRRGLNENYARELLELHTLGVDGGYTQQDIIEVARAFTGWTIAPERRADAQRRADARGNAMAAARDGEFRFARARHDGGAKVVLGHRLPAGGGIDDGERVLDIVASHPATARHIAAKLARRFVADDPPEALVARVAARFRETNGDLREVVRAVITAPEFFAAEARGAKVKTPLEFVTSALRATGGELADAQPALDALRELGMSPYMCQPPTGYDDVAEAWVSPGALVSRMNIARTLAGDRATEIGGPAFQRR